MNELVKEDLGGVNEAEKNVESYFNNVKLKFQGGVKAKIVFERDGVDKEVVELQGYQAMQKQYTKGDIAAMLREKVKGNQGGNEEVTTENKNSEF